MLCWGAVKPTKMLQSEDHPHNTATDLPLVVDLDGTLLQTDLMHEATLQLIHQKPWVSLLIPFWLVRGRAYLKRRVAQAVKLDYTLLPIHRAFFSWLRGEKESGRQIVLATASDREMAKAAVAHLGVFDEVLGSDGKRNLKGRKKLKAIAQYCGPEFDYAGNSRSDQVIWEASRQAILVNTTKSVEVTARRNARVARVFAPARDKWKAAIRSLRPYQWAKNLLVFLPAFTSHGGIHWLVLAKSIEAFLAFSLCASGTYIANDLLDLEEDRLHSSKRQRPLACGECSIPVGILTAGVSVLAGLAIAASAGTGLLLVIMFYLCLTASYSLYLKRFLLVDVLVLAILYTTRVVAGHVAASIAFSVWLSSFAFFLFLSLAFAKRAAELVKLGEGSRHNIPGRGYNAEDLQVITMAGICSGFLSSLVLALYINSDAVRVLYRQPVLLWAVLPLLLYYVGQVWIICRRGQLDDDPIVYTAKTPSTYVLAAAVVMIVVAATVG
jgi:4-hydroxybenzoate polyprenyltransferase